MCVLNRVIKKVYFLFFIVRSKKVRFEIENIKSSIISILRRI